MSATDPMGFSEMTLENQLIMRAANAQNTLDAKKHGSDLVWPVADRVGWWSWPFNMVIVGMSSPTRVIAHPASYRPGCLTLGVPSAKHLGNPHAEEIDFWHVLQLRQTVERNVCP